jgi:hypothetical protein
MVGWQLGRPFQIKSGPSNVVLLETARTVRELDEFNYTIGMQVTEMQMNDDLPFIWRKNYRNEMASPERLLEIAHEKARQYLSRAAVVATRPKK